MNVFELVAKLTLDSSEYEQSLTSSKEKTGGLKSALTALGGGAAVAVAAATTAAVALGKASLEGYAEYEQLIGGVETLFKDSAGTVQEYAANAYKTAGLSANEYMETVTSFSASLLQSLGGDTEKAAQYADKAITDMSDNANKMGSSMESIQTAYQGFAKQNYTMLDNLKLGYGGTKSEMERLILDAEKLDSSFKASRDTNGDLAMSYSDIVDAIHIVQTDMGITGTTAKEASTTIQGSLQSAKAAWSNLVVGIADENANLEELVNNFVESVVTAGQNILPRIEIILQGMSQMLSQAGTTFIPLIVDAIVSNQLLINIFEHNTPLHDGAVIIKGDRVTSATCYLPLSDNMDLSKELGTRHRAGVGISEVTDTFTIIVSEETGYVSVAYGGELYRNVDSDYLRERMEMLQNKPNEEPRKFRLWHQKGRAGK